MNVLIVEDDLPIADLLREALESSGHYVYGIARTVEEAMEEAEKQRPDYAIVDVHLADGSLGTDFAARLRRFHDAKVLFSTGNDDFSALWANKGDAVMTKPYLMRDAVRGLKIVDELALYGRTDLKFPPNFRLIGLGSEDGAAEKEYSPSALTR